MKTILDFIVNNWQYLSFALVVLLEFVLLIIKRKKTVSIPEGIITDLINLINEAEVKLGAGNGKDKLEYVINTILIKYPCLDISAIKEAVEFILTSPQKK